MNSTLMPEISSFCVTNLRTPRALPRQCWRIASGRNSLLLRAIRALNLAPWVLCGSGTTYFVQNKSETLLRRHYGV